MKHRQYCCDASRDLFEEYYSRQNGGEIPVFAGRRFHRSQGLKSILSGFVRRLVLPFFQTNAESMLKNAAKTGMEVANDVIEAVVCGFRKEACAYGYKRGVEDIVFQSTPTKRQKGATVLKGQQPRRRQARYRRDIFP